MGTVQILGVTTHQSCLAIYSDVSRLLPLHNLQSWNRLLVKRMKCGQPQAVTSSEQEISTRTPQGFCLFVEVNRATDALKARLEMRLDGCLRGSSEAKLFELESIQ